MGIGMEAFDEKIKSENDDITIESKFMTSPSK